MVDLREAKLVIIYKTTNIVNGKIYVGQNKNNNRYYLGGGTLLQKAIKKYGKDTYADIKKELNYDCKR